MYLVMNRCCRIMSPGRSAPFNPDVLASSRFVLSVAGERNMLDFLQYRQTPVHNFSKYTLCNAAQCKAKHKKQTNVVLLICRWIAKGNLFYEFWRHDGDTLATPDNVCVSLPLVLTCGLTQLPASSIPEDIVCGPCSSSDCEHTASPPLTATECWSPVDLNFINSEYNAFVNCTKPCTALKIRWTVHEMCFTYTDRLKLVLLVGRYNVVFWFLHL